MIAARVTAENPVRSPFPRQEKENPNLVADLTHACLRSAALQEDGFKPCGGRVDRISIDHWAQSVWSYFALGTETAGNVHEWADSQLGER